MGCCEATNQELLGPASGVGRARSAGWTDSALELDRRAALKGMLAVAGAVWVSGCSAGSSRTGTRVQLAFCGQLLCVIPYEVTRARGHFADAGFDIELIYTRGGNAAMQALVGGAVDYAGTSFDVALQAAAHGARIRRVLSTGRLPLFALAVSPEQSGAIREVRDLGDRTVGVSALGNADHALLLFLLDQAGVEAQTVRFAAIGTNLFDALRIGQIDAGMLQEPALSLTVEAGGRELVNFMEIDETREHLGGPYEFMGVSVRTEERDRRLPEIRRLGAALERGLVDTRSLPPDEIIDALPDALIAGGDTDQLREVIERYRLSIYPESTAIDVAAAERVLRAQEIAELLSPGEIELSALLDTSTDGT
jgi:NitT/TauT family transport system substrate-binding protein